MTSTTPEQLSSLDDMSMLFRPDLNDDFSEFFDFGLEDSAFSEALPDLSEDFAVLLSSHTVFGNSTNAPSVQPSVAGTDRPPECQDNLEPDTVTLSQLDLQTADKSYHMELDSGTGSQHGSVYPVPHQQPRDDTSQQQQRILPALAPRGRRAARDDKRPERAKSGKRRMKTYPEEDITCRYCNIKTETPGQLRKHQKSLHDDPQEQCSICDHKTKFKRDLNRHYRVHHPKSADDMGIPVFTSSCPVKSCGKTFKRPDHMTRHLKSAHAFSSNA